MAESTYKGSEGIEPIRMLNDVAGKDRDSKDFLSQVFLAQVFLGVLKSGVSFYTWIPSTSFPWRIKIWRIVLYMECTVLYTTFRAKALHRELASI